MRKIVFVRHATTKWNREDRLQGHIDKEIDTGGREEAFLLARELAPLGISCIVSSDLRRAMETAEIIGSVLKITPSSDPRLREVTFGSLEGMNKEDVINKYGNKGEEIWGQKHHNYDFSMFGGESREDVLKRHLSFMKDIKNICGPGVVLLVGHGRGLNTLLDSLGEPPDLKRGEYRVVNV